MIRYVLMDIEGTTTPITFVHEVLFPYSARHLPAFISARAQDPTVRRCLDDVAATVQQEEGRRIDDAQAVAQLLAWITQDRKHPALKTLQGLVWRHGYESGAYTAQVYPEVPGCLRAWKDRGLTLGIYSSGSVDAQILLFRHTQDGDLTSLLSQYFDTAVGPKREAASYRRIVQDLQQPAAAVLFLSDIPEELDAARAAGLATLQIVRPGTVAGTGHPTAADFRAAEASLV
jgi:enolase-phosphatase E1